MMPKARVSVLKDANLGRRFLCAVRRVVGARNWWREIGAPGSTA